MTIEKKSLFILLIILPILLIGQNKTELEIIQYHQEIYDGLLDEKTTPNYLYPIVRADSLLSKTKDTQFEHLAYQSLSWYYSYVGEFRKSLELYSKTLDAQSLSTTDLIDIKEFKPIDAKREILSNTESYDFVLINEAHHKPEHRVFATTLLSDLKSKGFTNIAIEAIGLSDSIVNYTKIPDENLGGLTMEPNYSNLIRESIQLEYQIIPYDYGNSFDFEKRDSISAVHILENRKKIDGKTLIYCGFEHIDKSQKSLAYWLEKLTNKNVLTINQTKYSEEFERKFESPYYQMAVDIYPFKHPFVLKKNKIPFKENENSEIYVFHPRANYISGRASWLTDYEIHKKRFLVLFPNTLFQDIPENSLVQVYFKEEFNKGIPIDQFLFRKLNSLNTPVIIPSGEFILIVENHKRKNLLRINFDYDIERGLTINN